MNAERIETLQSEILRLEKTLEEKKQELSLLEKENEPSENISEGGITNSSRPEEKIALFRSLFRGREDVYAKRFESKKTGKSGYQPVCANEWVQGICRKPAISCASCDQRAFQPITDETIRYHLAGEMPPARNDGPAIPFVMGVYPLLTDESCCFLAVDFDKDQWEIDIRAFLETCKSGNIPASLERSRSGNGGHIWIFFERPVQASKARILGSILMTKTLDRRPEIGLDSFDRFFPNQDTLPRGGLGNLIALPLQKKARAKNHSVFLNENLEPYLDQWAYLSSIQRLSEEKLDLFIRDAAMKKELLPVSFDEHDDAVPWKSASSESLPIITETLPTSIDLVLSNQIFIDHRGLPPILRNRILRLASFSNPEFYRSQSMRLPTWNKPRILYCYEYFPHYIGLPIGCLEALLKLFSFYKINSEIKDERTRGSNLNIHFLGELRPDQISAAEALLSEPTGILSATTAFGKTIAALWIISQRRVNTLILVHRKQLMDQWVERIAQFLDIPKAQIGRYGGGKDKRSGKIDIAVMQSICRGAKDTEWLKDYGQIIVDECHHISASSFEQVTRQAPAFYKMGLTATVTRKDGQQPIVFMNLGEVRYCVDPRKNAEERSFDQKVILRKTHFRHETTISQSLNIQEIFNAVWNDQTRNELIINDIVSAHENGREILILSERIEHLIFLRESLHSKVANIFLFKGGMGKKQLKNALADMDALQQGSHRVILSTGKYLGEGIDFPCLDTLFLVFPISWKGTLTQYAGRLNREFFGKSEVRIYDYIDQYVPMLMRMYAKREKGYKMLGFSITGEGNEWK